MNLLTNFDNSGEWDDGPMKRARMDEMENYVNPSYDDIVTAVRNFRAHPDENQAGFLSELRNREFVFYDPTPADIVNSQEIYGYQYYHIEKTGPIDLIRLDEIPDEAYQAQNLTPAQCREFVAKAVKELNEAAAIYEMRHTPRYEKYVDVRKPTHMFFAYMVDMLWKKKVHHRFRMGGTIKYRREVQSGPGSLAYDTSLHEDSLTCVVSGLTEVNNIWGRPPVNLNPRMLHSVGFQITFRFEADPGSEYKTVSDSTIRVIPKLIPAVATDNEMRTDLLDYIGGRVQFNAQENEDHAPTSQTIDFIQLQIEAS